MSLASWFVFGYERACIRSNDGDVAHLQRFMLRDTDSHASSEEEQAARPRMYDASELYDVADALPQRRQRADRDVRIIRPSNGILSCSSLTDSILCAQPQLASRPGDRTATSTVVRVDEGRAPSSSSASPSTVTTASSAKPTALCSTAAGVAHAASERAGACIADVPRVGSLLFGGFRAGPHNGVLPLADLQLITIDAEPPSVRFRPVASSSPATPCARYGACFAGCGAGALLLGGTADTGLQLGVQPGALRSTLGDGWLATLPAPTAPVTWTALVVEPGTALPAVAFAGCVAWEQAQPLQFIHFGGFAARPQQQQQQQQQQTDAVAGRANATTVTEDDEVLLPPLVSGELQLLTVSVLGAAASVRGARLQTFGTAPTARGGHAMVLFPASASLCVLGGWGAVAEAIEDPPRDAGSSQTRLQRHPNSSTLADEQDGDDHFDIDLGGAGRKAADGKSNCGSGSSGDSDFFNALDDDYDANLFDSERDDGAVPTTAGVAAVAARGALEAVLPSRQDTAASRCDYLADCYILGLTAKVWRRVDFSLGPLLRLPRCYSSAVLVAHDRALILGGETREGRAVGSALLVRNGGRSADDVSFTAPQMIGAPAQVVASRHGPMLCIAAPTSGGSSSLQQRRCVVVGGTGWHDGEQRVYSAARSNDCFAFGAQVTCMSTVPPTLQQQHQQHRAEEGDGEGDPLWEKQCDATLEAPLRTLCARFLTAANMQLEAE